MAHLDGFDANKVEPNAPMQPIPPATYLAVIEQSERKQTKNKTGDMMEYTFRVVEGQYKGRKVKTRLNLWNSNEVAKKIAWGDQSAICRAVGVMQPNDTTDLHNIPLEIIVSLTDDAKYNEIKGYQRRGESAAAVASAPTPAQSGGSADRPGWMG